MMKYKLVFILTFFVFPFHSCTSNKKMGDNQIQRGHYRLYSYPEKLPIKKFDQQRYRKLVFISSNEFNGNINAHVYPVKNRFNEKRELKIGGLSAMRAYYDIFNNQFKESLVYVDAGSFLSPYHDHNYTIFLYNYLSVDVAALGINEFKLETRQKDYTQYLESLTSKSEFKIISSNLFDLAAAKPLKLKGIKDSYIKTVNGVKIGFIGILDQDMARKIPSDKINGLYIQNIPINILEKSNKLRKKGAQAIVLLTNSTIDCNSQIAHEEDLPLNKVNFVPRESSHCDIFNNLLYKALTQIPPKTVDLIITSGKNLKVANFIKGYPIMQNEGEGRFLSWAELYFDTKHGTVDQDQTVIHQPVQLCHNFLKSNQDCYKDGKLENEELIPAHFLGQKIEIKKLPKL